MRAGVVLGTLALAALVRGSSLEALGWYTDEGTQLAIARTLQTGHWGYLALTQSTLLVARPPLFPLLLHAWFHLVPFDIVGLRILTSGLGLLICLTLYAFAWQGLAWRTCALAALGYALYPLAALYNRLGFSYNLLALLLLWCVYGLCAYARTRRPHTLALAALALGVGGLCDIWALALWPAFISVLLSTLWYTKPPAHLWAIPLAALPMALYALALWLTAPAAALFDASYTLSRLAAPVWPTQFFNVVDNAAHWLGSDVWLLPALGGCLCVRPRALRRILLLVLALTFLALARTNALYSLSAYYLIPLWPLLPLGTAALITRLSDLSHAHLPSRWRSVPLLLTACFFALQLRPALFPTPTPIDDFLLDPTAARAALAYLQSHVSAAEVVIASPTLAWAIHRLAPTTDFQMAIAQTGQATPHFPAHLPPERWAFDARFANAQWVVVDNLWHNWAAVHIPQVEAWLNAADPARIVWQQGPITIYHFPP